LRSAPISSRGGRAACALSLLLLALALGFVPRASGQGEGPASGSRTFEFTGAPQTFTVPDGIFWLTIDAQGGHGGQEYDDHTAAGGRGGGVTATVPVTPGEVLTVRVGEFGWGHGGYGWAHGGDHGTTNGNAQAHSAAGGGGASGVDDGVGNPLVVAGGGGGGGGDDTDDAWGGRGGDGGHPASRGFNGNWASEVGGTNDDAVGGCGGCEQGHDGAAGESEDNAAQKGAAGGGGGGGVHGGGGGKSGAYEAFQTSSVGGGGGGAGSSYVKPHALLPHFYTSARGCGHSTGGALCNGQVLLSWGAAPHTIRVDGGAGQDVPISQDFGPLSAKVTDARGVPATGVPVRFSAPDVGPSGYFPGFVTQMTVTTDANGVATVPQLTANGVAGRWTAEASVDGVPIPARYGLLNDVASTTTIVSSSASSSSAGEAVSFEAVVQSAARFQDARATGRVQFWIDGAPAEDPVVLDPGDGSASSPPIASLPAGDHPVKAEYLGDENHAPSSRTITQTVTKAATTVELTSSPNPSSVGQPVVLAARVAVHGSGGGVPTGDVAFELEDGTPLGVVALDGAGEAELASSAVPVGLQRVVARYAGDGDHAASDGSVVQSVGDELTATLVSSTSNPSTYGEPVTLSATARRSDAGVPLAGRIAFRIDDDELCPPAELGAGGTITCQLTEPLPPGTHSVRADFEPADGSGDEPSYGTLEQRIVPAATTTAVTVAPEPAPLGTALRMEAQVAAVVPGAESPSGTVQFFADGSALGAPVPVQDGRATLEPACVIGAAICSLAAGPHAIEARYVDDAPLPRFSASHGATLHRVGAATTRTLVSSDASPALQGQAVRFSARVDAQAASAGTPTGPVQFVVDGQPFGEPVAVRRGVAVSLPARELALGAHEVVARFLGSSGYAASDASMTQQVDAPPPPAAPPPGAVSPAQAPPPRFIVRSTRARVDSDGTLALRVACSGAPGRRCAGRLTLRTVRAMPARLWVRAARERAARVKVATRLVSLAPGSDARLKVDLDGNGARLLARRRARDLRVRARMNGEPGSVGALRLIRSSAPAIAIDRRAARLDGAGRLVLRLSCPAPWRTWCDGELTLAAGGERLGRRALMLAGGPRQRVRVALEPAARAALRAAGRVRVRTLSRIPAGRATVRERTLEVSDG
jgi:hypothetical protein